jgi:hypothetical protein
MENLGIGELIVVGGIILILVGLFARRSNAVRNSGPTLVLKSFKIDKATLTQTPVEIVGRIPGFTAWLLTIMGLDAETSLSVSNSYISFKSSSLS